ncbi:MAG: FGGY-family carbohydrate kinase [Nitrococcus sp.]|nr:FGGY-family carbohydrate kinase [Nitrococcus sp.]
MSATEGSGGSGSGVAIGIDVGTGGARATLVDRDAAVLASVAVPFAPGRKRDPWAWWEAVTRALAALRWQASLDAVRALAIDATSGTVLPIDAAGRPLGPASLYNDPADPADVAALDGIVPATSAAHGVTSPLAKFLHLRHLAGFARMLHQADWIVGRLSGRFDATDENNALKTGYDPVSRRWPDFLAQLDADTALLPCVHPPATPLATIRPDVADTLGLPRRSIVAAGTTDGCAAFLATGAAATGEGVTSLGTTLTLKQLCDVPLFAPQFGIYSHRLGNRWLAGGASNVGGAVLAAHFNPPALVRLSAEIDPAVESPLDYYPLLRPGERFPVADPALVPRMVPRPDDDAAFLHGLLEGIARVEALGYRRLAELGAPGLVAVRTVGGGARNAAWTAIRARVLGVSMQPAAAEQAAAGAARLALAALD